jgi:hypothetical protein
MQPALARQCHTQGHQQRFWRDGSWPLLFSSAVLLGAAAFLTSKHPEQTLFCSYKFHTAAPGFCPVRLLLRSACCCPAVSPTGSEELLIHAEDIVNMPKRPDVVGGVRRFVDISVPRNVAPGINAEQHAAIVYNVDDLKEVVVANKEARAAAAAEAEILLR